jgi:hypothetical protein
MKDTKKFNELMAKLDEAIENASVETAESVCNELNKVELTEALCRKLGREPITKEQLEDEDFVLELKF